MRYVVQLSNRQWLNYSSANPDVPPYVKVGSRVKKGDTVCIIEAMKVMNQIESSRWNYQRHFS